MLHRRNRHETGLSRPVLAIASGANRIDEDRVAVLVGEPIACADANFVREVTGFAIGGVPPVRHKYPPTVLIDDTLAAFSEIWTAAGTPHSWANYVQ
jgi:prolyl-tRNA editing enzyme YbaK/EbsC (Cys-tRNA(Pro) deacylase)